METAPIPIKEPLIVLCCPLCHKEIPIIKPNLQEGMTKLIIECSCLNQSIEVNIEDYLDILSDNTYKLLVNSNNQTTEKYCINCQQWMSNECLFYHHELLNAHTLIDSELNIACGEHKENFIWYCKDCKKSICIKCKKDHKNHKKKIIENKELFSTFLKDIKNIKNNMNDYQKDKEQFNNAIEMLIQQLIHHKEVVNEIYNKNEKMHLELEKLCKIITTTGKLIENIPCYPFNKTLKYFAANSMIQLQLDFGLINKCNNFLDQYKDSNVKMVEQVLFKTILNPEIQYLIKPNFINREETTVRYQLLYSARQHGNNAASFHEHCDNKGPTITVIKTNKGNVFGGYTSQSWNQLGIYKKDNDSFLFSLDLKKIYPILKSSYAIYCHSNYGPTFGKGPDIYIDDMCLSTNSSSTSFPSSYTNGNLNEFNASDYYFNVSNLEVYQVLIGDTNATLIEN